MVCGTFVLYLRTELKNMAKYRIEVISLPLFNSMRTILHYKSTSGYHNSHFNKTSRVRIDSSNGSGCLSIVLVLIILLALTILLWGNYILYDTIKRFTNLKNQKHE